MIDLTEILILTDNINALQPPIRNYLLPTFISFLLAMFGGSYLYDRSDKLISYLPIAGALFIIFIPFINGDQVEYMNAKYDSIQERDNLYDQQIKTASCNDVRLHIIDVLENDHIDYVRDKQDWVKDMYYHKCEIPLREEVMKLER